MKENESLEALSVQDIETILGIIWSDDTLPCDEKPLTPRQLEASRLNAEYRKAIGVKMF